MTARDEFVEADDGVRLFVQSLGTGNRTVIVPNGYYLFELLAPLAADCQLLFCDPRNRGRSQAITDSSKLERGIHHDVEDVDAIRRHFGVDRVDFIGHSYMGVAVMLFAMRYGEHADRVIQMGSIGPDYAQQFPPDLVYDDGTVGSVLARIGELQGRRTDFSAEEFCRRFWALLREIYVLDPADANRLKWEPCHWPNERRFMKQFTEDVLPSIQRVRLMPDDFAKVQRPVLAIHGRQDRSAPYGGGREWVSKLPNARLLTIEGAAHVPWIEQHDRVLGGIRSFLNGEWPEGAERIMRAC